MTSYVVLYRDDTLDALDPPYAFVCMAEDMDHAEEQCQNAEPGCEVVWVAATNSVDSALMAYWNASDPN